MLLAIDAGNTNVLFAVYDGDRLRGTWRASTDARRTADEYAVWLTQLMSLADLAPADIDGCIVASVVPDVVFALKTLAARYFGVTARLIGEPGLELGIGARVPNPAEVGADRLVNALAAREAHGAPLIVIDFGTATTFDIIGSQGDFVGGVIAPGINLSLDALSNAAAKLPRVAIVEPPTVIATSTIPAMQSGVFWGYVGLIEGLVARIRAELGTPAKVLATGGLAPLLAGATTVIDAVEPDLTLTGLRLIHERNQPS